MLLSPSSRVDSVLMLEEPPGLTKCADAQGAGGGHPLSVVEPHMLREVPEIAVHPATHQTLMSDPLMLRHDVGCHGGLRAVVPPALGAHIPGAHSPHVDPGDVRGPGGPGIEGQLTHTTGPARLAPVILVSMMRMAAREEVEITVLLRAGNSVKFEVDVILMNPEGSCCFQDCGAPTTIRHSLKCFPD